MSKRKPADGGDVPERLLGIVADLAENSLPPGKLKPGARLREDLGFDSVAMVDLMVEVESHFGVYFDPLAHDLGEIFSTLGSLEKFIAGYGSER